MGPQLSALKFEASPVNGPTFPILMVVSVIPCRLSARAVIDPRIESSRAHAR